MAAKRRGRSGTEELRAAADEQAQFSDEDVLGARTSAWFVEGIDAERSLDDKQSSDSLPQMYARLAGPESEEAPQKRGGRNYTVVVVFGVAALLIVASVIVFLTR